MPRIGFLGFGNMAQAIAGGIIANGFIDENDVYAYDPVISQIEKFNKNIVLSESALQLVQEVKYIFLCVKPQAIEDALVPAAKALLQDQIIISIAAGVSVERIRNITDGACRVVRVMPNAPLLLGSGCTAIAKPQDIDNKDYLYIKNVFGCVGKVYDIPEDKFNEIIPVNGSSPAFIYLFAKIIAESAAKHGLDYKTSIEMFSDTLIGSARMLKETDHNADELIDMVSSKGGTTVAALAAMEESGFTDSIKSGFDSCVSRAYELGNLGSKQ